jgi:hypothetical protein
MGVLLLTASYARSLILTSVTMSNISLFYMPLAGTSAHINLDHGRLYRLVV